MSFVLFKDNTYLWNEILRKKIGMKTHRRTEKTCSPEFLSSVILFWCTILTNKRKVFMITYRRTEIITYNPNFYFGAVNTNTPALGRFYQETKCSLLKSTHLSWNLKTKLSTFQWLSQVPNQLGLGVLELWSDKQTEIQRLQRQHSKI